MSSFTGTFSAVEEASNAIKLYYNQSIVYTLTEAAADTWAVVLERAKAGTTGWELVRTFTTDQAAVVYVHTESFDAYYRLRCKTFTTQTIDYTLADSVGEVQVTFTNPKTGLDEIQFTDEGVTIKRKLTVDGQVDMGNVSTLVVDSASPIDIITSAGDITLDTANGITIDAGEEVTIASADGDISISANTAGDNVVLTAANNTSYVYVNGALKLDRLATAVGAAIDFKPITAVTNTSAARALTLPAALNIAGSVKFIKDEGGSAGTNAITVTPAAGLIDGAAAETISSDYGVLGLYANGTNWQRLFALPGTHRLTLNGYAKVGATAGWTFGAGDNIGRLAVLPAGQTAATLVVPVHGLPVGSKIIAFNLLGQIESAGNAATLDASLRKLTVAAADLTDASVEAMTQISVTADTAVGVANGLKTLTAVETVDQDDSFYILITGTTAASTDIDLAAVVVHFRY
jgi:hypothetical protein